MTLVRSGVAQGKRLLMDAALRLMAHSRSLSSLGLRELAREAGLNPNTFYRHFQSVDELGMALIRHIADQLRQPLRDLRREAAQRAAEGGEGGPRLLGVDLGRGRLVCHETVALFFRFVEENPEAFIVGMRELHGASPLLRAELREVMEGFAQDMAEDIQNLQLVALDGEGVKRLSSLISRHLFQMSLDYLEQVDQRPRICAEAEEMIVTLFAGASVLRSLEQAPRA
ncbi:TetR family transcriptional regulator [Pseudomonas indica]|uniref:Transcriptional regulator, TetR family n=1 Tax=Pseudomonas indica TaxID=137658 RepID=A0A1G8XRU8_9PSED|nr:TetR family transcriptional regulator [Pseudomonas indica]MBU3054808.1 TetR family transcriptional regulator [Pseudomonas indica]SDJ93166.1 transcriptional regulator, TetR family [Pseudomonas indica]